MVLKITAHINIIIAGMLVTFYFITGVNTSMAFLSSDMSIKLTVAFCLLAVILAAAVAFELFLLNRSDRIRHFLEENERKRNAINALFVLEYAVILLNIAFAASFIAICALSAARGDNEVMNEASVSDLLFIFCLTDILLAAFGLILVRKNERREEKAGERGSRS